MVNKRLHLIDNKIYKHDHNFEQTKQNPSQYDTTTNKTRYNLTKLFKEDQKVNSDANLKSIVEGTTDTDYIKSQEAIKNNLYSEDQVF